MVSAWPTMYWSGQVLGCPSHWLEYASNPLLWACYRLRVDRVRTGLTIGWAGHCVVCAGHRLVWAGHVLGWQYSGLLWSRPGLAFASVVFGLRWTWAGLV
jgi:hypothetical protein